MLACAFDGGENMKETYFNEVLDELEKENRKIDLTV